VRAYPSISEKEKLAKEEKDRLEKRKSELGEAGLTQKAKELSAAQTENDREPPLDMLTVLPIPSTSKIIFHQFDVTKNAEDFPFYAEIYDLKSNFVYVTAAFDTSRVPLKLRSYLLLFLDLILESPVKTKTELLPYEAVVAALEEEVS
jgi:Zn-dependent M16 (insulinase) family peptidase